MKYLVPLFKEMKEIIKKDLPEKFALTFDGWTEDRKHFVAIFASYGEGKRVFLAMTRLPDPTNQTAVNHAECIENVLAEYGKTLDNVVCTVADNTNTNPCIAREEEEPPTKKARFTDSEEGPGKPTSTNNYLDFKFLNPSSVVVGRFFSVDKYVFADARKSILPEHLEMVLMLKINTRYWSVAIIDEVIQSLKE
jgi:hypothetical protein